MNWLWSILTEKNGFRPDKLGSVDWNRKIWILAILAEQTGFWSILTGKTGSADFGRKIWLSSILAEETGLVDSGRKNWFWSILIKKLVWSILAIKTGFGPEKLGLVNFD